MRGVVSNYATILANKRVLYVPACLLIEKISTLFSQATRVANAGRLPEETYTVLVKLLQRLHIDLQCTAAAYEEQRSRLFMGDWKNQRQGAEKVFFALLHTLRKIRERAPKVCKIDIDANVENLRDAWDRLGSVIDAIARAGRNARDSSDQTVYFQCSSAATWQKTMASIVLSLAYTLDGAPPDTYLILLCYNRIKAALIRQIEDLEYKGNTEACRRFDKDKILCVSDTEVHLTCPMCMRFTESIGKSPEMQSRTSMRL